MSGAAPDMVAFRERVASIRAIRKMTLQDVADAAGFTKSHVWELENGRSRNPTIRMVWALARALGVSPAWLLGLDVNQAAIDPIALRIAALIDQEVEARIRASVPPLPAPSSEVGNG